MDLHGPFRKQLAALVLPVAAQNLLSALVSASDALALGLLDQASPSAVSLAAQYWGRGDQKTVEDVLMTALRASVLTAAVFFHAGARQICRISQEVDFMDQRERMLAGLPYKAWLDGLEEDRLLCKKKIYQLNQLSPEFRERIPALLKELLGKTGNSIMIEPPFHCDYGWNIEVGENFFANYNLTVLDVGKVKIGDNAQIAPNVSIYTAGHPIHADSRNSGYEYGIPVTIGDNVWIGGNAVILPGVVIGNNVVIGAGSVVTKNIPDHMIAAGNPCRVIREITEEDRRFYFKDRVFDAEAWAEITG